MLWKLFVLEYRLLPVKIYFESLALIFLTVFALGGLGKNNTFVGLQIMAMPMVLGGSLLISFLRSKGRRDFLRALPVSRATFVVSRWFNFLVPSLVLFGLFALAHLQNHSLEAWFGGFAVWVLVIYPCLMVPLFLLARPQFWLELFLSLVGVIPAMVIPLPVLMSAVGHAFFTAIWQLGGVWWLVLGPAFWGLSGLLSWRLWKV